MHTKLRIVAGSLRGRKLNCRVSPQLRPAPQMVREALFSILGAGIAGQPFYDLFAGTGAIGMEAVSRGAFPVTFVERDARAASEIEAHLRAFDVADQARVVRGDVYRWLEPWDPPLGPVNVFLGPPYGDLDQRADDLAQLLTKLQTRVPAGSVLVLQAETAPILSELPDVSSWERRQYGRNLLLFWVKPDLSQTPA
jgi:16S rRNA (guanine(966)-N(2))-methyltransferase RsmD